MRLLVVFAIAVAGLQGGCATIINGSTQDLAVSSNPPGATVQVGEDVLGTTPCTIELKRKHDHVLTFQLDGYELEQVTVMKVISGAVAGNILAGGLIGWGVDAATGAQYRLVPETITVDLQPARGGQWQAARMPASTDLTPERRLRELARLHDEGLITDDEHAAMRKAIIADMTASNSGH